MTPSLAMQFLIAVQSFSPIQQGRIAMIQANPNDMFTYDALIAWRYFLMESPPTRAAGQSLILLTALPRGTNYDPQSTLYEQVIQISLM